jgi:hypothetical protein
VTLGERTRKGLAGVAVGVLEHAYRHTRQALSRAFAERHAALERAGFVPRGSQSVAPPPLSIKPP